MAIIPVNQQLSGGETVALHARALAGSVPAHRSLLRRIDLSTLTVTACLLACDTVALALAFGGAYHLRFKVGLPLLEELPRRGEFYASVIFWALPIWLVLFAVHRLYDRRFLFSGFREYIRVVNACTAGMMAVIVISFLDISLIISRGWLLLVWLLSVLFVCGARFGVRRLIRVIRRRGRLTRSALIVGVNEEARALAEQLVADRGSGLRVVGFADDALEPATNVLGGLTVLGKVDDLPQLVTRWKIKEIIVATTALSRDQLLDLYWTFSYDESVELRMSSGLFEILTTGVIVEEVSCVPLMTPQRVRITGVDAVLKTVLDYTAALTGLLLLSPLCVMLAIAIKLDSPGPALHRRRVLGRSGRSFDAFKFRSMHVDADERLASDPELQEEFRQEFKLKADPRITRVGRILRRTSLDELPQLLNVLRGEMSLIGPRMISPEETNQYGKWQLNLLTVKPGITGPWQVHGRNDLPYGERVRLSMQYIRNYSIWLDLEILLRTVPAVLHARGAY